MADYITWVIIIAILSWAIGYIIVQKRKGVKCIGCASEAKCNCQSHTNHACDCKIDPAANCQGKPIS